MAAVRLIGEKPVDGEIGLSYVVRAGDSFHGGNLRPAQATQYAT
jgi:hypothetical protein